MGQDQSDQSRYVLAQPRFVLLGDSLTDQSKRPGGWSTHLAWEYNRRAEVVTRGFSGYTTRWALNSLNAMLPPSASSAPGLGAVALVTILLGTNDSVCASTHTEYVAQHVPTQEYRQNLRSLVSEVRKRYGKDVAVVLITPPPITESERDKSVQEYAKACVDVAAELGASALDLRSAFLSQANWQSMFWDGVHFNDSGDQFLAKILIQHIKDNFPDLAPPILQPSEGFPAGSPVPMNSMPMHLPPPYWANEQGRNQMFLDIADELAKQEVDVCQVLEVREDLRVKN
eukprot:TRINITY_DN47990_c0_g1_i1.p1 TRINITY_DN47990_c0_g1~~TRINITY_DN47990_c0_g1_i1.p1  ORF type:complete len:286 (-),score=46.59 TRINITY_DN47990_c0_g1_i1:275-1132(-)